jgi:hypothetical protein
VSIRRRRREGYLGEGVDDEDDVARLLDERAKVSALALDRTIGAVLFDGVPDPVGEEFVLFGAPPFLEVVGHPRRDRVTRHLLAPFSGVEEKGQVRVLLANGVEELDPRLPRHVVIRHHAVERFVRESRQPTVGVRGGDDVEAVVLAFEERRRHIREVRLVVDVEHADGIVQSRRSESPVGQYPCLSSFHVCFRPSPDRD